MDDNKSRLLTNSNQSTTIINCLHFNGGTGTSRIRLFPIFSYNAEYTAFVFAQFNDSIIQNVRRKRQTVTTGLKRYDDGTKLLSGVMRCMSL